jgi:hypothetical protein
METETKRHDGFQRIGWAIAGAMLARLADVAIIVARFLADLAEAAHVRARPRVER